MCDSHYFAKHNSYSLATLLKFYNLFVVTPNKINAFQVEGSVSLALLFWKHSSISGDSERPTSLRLPYILLIIIMLCNNNTLLRNQVSRIKNNIKLPNHANINTNG